MNVAKIMTPGLDEEWEVFFDWAREKDAEDVLKLLIDCALRIKLPTRGLLIN